MSERQTLDIVVEPSPLCPEGADARFSYQGQPRPVRQVRVWPGGGESLLCQVEGVSQQGPVPALAVLVEDSGEGDALVIYGGDLGLRLTPERGEPFGEAYLRISPEDLVA